MYIALSYICLIEFFFVCCYFIVTDKIKTNITKINDKDIAVTDTQGKFDTNGMDWQHSNDLVGYLKGCGGINAFIIVYNGANQRLDSDFKKMVKSFTDMLCDKGFDGKGSGGSKFWDHVIFIITHLKINMNDEKTKDLTKRHQEWLQNFKNKMSWDIYDNQKEAIVIGVDNFNENSYKTAIGQLLQKLPKTKFKCDKLKSPFDDDKVCILFDDEPYIILYLFLGD